MERRKLLCIEVAYRNVAVHISLNPMGRSFQWQLRSLTWTNLFERSTNQALFPSVFFPLNTRNTFDFSCYHPRKSCGFLHRCTSRRAKFCSLLSQFLGYFSSFLQLSFALHHKNHAIVWYYLLSLALTRSNSQHRSVVLSRLHSSRGLLFHELPRHIFVC